MKKLISLFIVCSAYVIFLLNSASAVTVGPAKLEYDVNPGDTVTGQFFLMNEEKEEKTYYSSFEKFTEKNGKRSYLQGERTEIAHWLNSTTSLTLMPGEHKYIPFTMTVPLDAPPGGHYAVVWWSDAAPVSNGNSVAIVTRVGILVYVRVSGAIEEAASLSTITEGAKAFFTKFPVKFNAIIQNEGNVHLKPGGEISIKNLFGKKRAALPINSRGVIILPQEKANFPAEWKPEFAFGPYQASVLVSYGEEGDAGQFKTLEKSKWIYIFPVSFVLVFIGALILLFVVLPYGIRSYNNWIISQALAIADGGTKLREKRAPKRKTRVRVEKSADQE